MPQRFRIDQAATFAESAGGELGVGGAAEEVDESAAPAQDSRLGRRYYYPEGRARGGEGA